MGHDKKFLKRILRGGAWVGHGLSMACDVWVELRWDSVLSRESA